MSGKHSKQPKPRKLLLVAAGVAGVLLLGLIGLATAVSATADVGDSIPRGVTVGGIELEGLDASTARQRLDEEFSEPLAAPIRVLVEGELVETVSRQELGASTDVQEALDTALSGLERLSSFDLFWQQVTGKAPAREHEVETMIDGAVLEEFIASLAARVDEPAQEASVAVAGRSVRITPGAAGFALDREQARELLTSAIQDPSAQVADLPGNAVEPAQTADDFEDVLVVRVGENTLQHFQDGRLVATYDVATGLPSFPTPLGEFEIVLKRYRPTWVNPATEPGRWGEHLPARIGPGPDNPLGTRAMNLNSPGIRIHGTSSVWSLGYNASHGCIRMARADVEELFDRVGEGTKVLIVRAGPDRLAPRHSDEPTLEQLVESDGAALRQQQPDPADPGSEPEGQDPSPSPEPDEQEEEPGPTPAPSPEPSPEPSPAPTTMADEMRTRFGLD